MHIQYSYTIIFHKVNKENKFAIYIFMCMYIYIYIYIYML